MSVKKSQLSYLRLFFYPDVVANK